ncbi:hypothetical protein BDP81DRAFT_125217 [Colletotrichum phormii]|uniref:Secreted protein n=1 Tax=Colletotrichum phormii TaxID=359342 RepID=A0AAJ0ELD8_9PEZI|nr:uncharacterized protein BDP81DRAFT_125217 [Colletotrichum phormii]KAK1640961.1 hypothetical protein BDP81DRAFT_125217 [Colletotrichum phormii]
MMNTIIIAVLICPSSTPRARETDWDARDNTNQQAAWRSRVCLITPLRASIRTNNANPKVGGQETPHNQQIRYQWRRVFN